MNASTEPSPPALEPSSPVKVDLLMALARALHEVGQPAHRLENTLLAAAATLGVPLEVMALPTGMLLSFNQPSGPATYVLREQPGRVNLRRWGRLSTLANEIIHGQVDPVAARKQLAAIQASPDPWGDAATIAAYVLSAGAFSIFFGGGTAELVVSLAVGLGVGLVAVLMQRARTSRLFELIAALVAGMIVGSIDVPLGGLVEFVEWIPLAAGLIILLPGIMLVDAIEELAHGHLVAGGARMAGVGVVFLAMTFGVALGLKITEPLPSAPMTLMPHPLSPWMALPALAVVALGSLIRFRAQLSDFWWILLGSAVSLGAARLGSALFGPVSGEFVAAFTLGIVSRACARKCTPELLVIPGLALLVPGSFGIRTVASIMGQDIDLAVHTAFEMFFIEMALVAGLLFSTALWRERTPATK